MSLLLRRHHKKEKPVQKERVSFPIHLGGGWYELSNGEKVQGKEEAKEKEGD